MFPSVALAPSGPSAHKVNAGDPPLTLLGLNSTLEHPCHGL